MLSDGQSLPSRIGAILKENSLNILPGSAGKLGANTECMQVKLFDF
jgi:hypothetical protein